MTCSRLLAALLLSLGLVVPTAPNAAACGNDDEDIVDYGPARTAYSPEAAAAAIAELDTYDAHTYQRPAFDDLRVWGAQAVPDLLAALKGRDQIRERDQLVTLIAYAKVKGTGATLIEIADGHMYDSINSSLYSAAADIDGVDVFPALLRSYKHDMSKAGHATWGLVRLREPTLAWIAKELPRAKHTSGLTSLVAKVAVPADQATVEKLVGLTRDQQARQHLASIAIDLGSKSTKLFDVLLAGLRSKDAETRTAAAWHVTAEDVPAAYAATFRGLLEGELGQPNAPVDHLARELIVLGSTDRRVIDSLFGRLGSDVVSQRMGSVLAITKYAHLLDETTATDLKNQVNDQLSRDQDDRFRKKLEKARDALDKRLARS